MTEIGAILFDKDGTLFDFNATWAVWAATLLDDLAGGQADKAEFLGGLIGFDTRRRAFERDSVVIAGTPGEIARALIPHLPGANPAGLIARMNVLAAAAPMVEAVPLRPLLSGLRGRGLAIGLATNDAEASARAHLEAVGVVDLFDFIAGFDSGHGAKPEAGMARAFAASCGLEPRRIAMVGDSRHDLLSGRAAGMRTVAVLTGLATREELAPLADIVLDSIGGLPVWLDAAGAGAVAGVAARAQADSIA